MIIPNGAPDFNTALHWVFKIYKLAGEKLYSENKLYGSKPASSITLTRK